MFFKDKKNMAITGFFATSAIVLSFENLVNPGNPASINAALAVLWLWGAYSLYEYCNRIYPPPEEPAPSLNV